MKDGNESGYQNFNEDTETRSYDNYFHWRVVFFFFVWIISTLVFLGVLSVLGERIQLFCDRSGIPPSWGLQYLVGAQGDFASPAYASAFIGFFLSTCLTCYSYWIFPLQKDP